MTAHAHTALFLDHHEARIYHVDREGADEMKVDAPHHHLHRHPKGASEKHVHPDDLKHFFADIAKALADAHEILVVGPSTAKMQFLKYAHEHDHALSAKIVGIETVDHPTDGQLIAYAKRYFHASPPRI